MNSSRSTTLAATLATALMLAAALPGWSATTGTVYLSGSVSSVLEIVVEASPDAANLPITTDVSGLAIATVNERSNKKAGYLVQLESASALLGGAGPRLRSVESADYLPYSLSYNGVSIDLGSGSAVITNASARTGDTGVTKVLAISFAGTESFLDESTYSDTLTLTIAAK